MEKVTGRRLAEVLADDVLGPLGMRDTAFRIGAGAAGAAGLDACQGADGALAAIPFEVPQDPEFHMGGGGLYGTAPITCASAGCG